MERRCYRASYSASRARDRPCVPSKEWRRAASCIRCRRRSPTSAQRSAATARPRSCSPPKHCLPTIRTQHETRSRKRSPATCAAAPDTSRSTRRLNWLRPVCAGKKSNQHENRCMAGKRSADPPIRPSAHRVIGKALRKVDAVAKVTGATRFADDLAFPRMLYCKLLRSTQAHARIMSIDTTAAKRLDGVHAILTGPDLPIPFGILPVSQDEHALCVDKVRFVGDPVAAVAATTEETATAALDLIKVAYEPLKSFDSATEAVAHPEPQIHDHGGSGKLYQLINLEFGYAKTGTAARPQVRG